MSLLRWILVAVALFCSAALLGVQIWTTNLIAVRSGQVLQDFAAAPSSTSMAEEKAKQEAIAAKIQNVRQSLFWAGLAGNLSAAAAVIAALSGAWIGFHQYLNLRQKERIERAANELRDIWENLGNNSAMVRAGSLSALQHYITPELKMYHGPIASALAFGSRSILAYSQNSLDIDFLLRTVTPVIEHAFKNIDRRTLETVSWQGIYLYRPQFHNLNLHGFDFRDTILINGHFGNANLSNTRFDAAKLIECRFDGGNLKSANLEHADLASASLKGADLSGANLRNVKILHTDFTDAKISNTEFSSRLDWRLTKNWRTCRGNDRLVSNLISKYGPEASGPRILMLMWEFMPFVSGGGWTAGHHLIQRARRKGARITLFAPWPQSALSPFAFGHEIEVVGVGVEHPEIDVRSFSGFSTYGAYGAYGAYGPAPSVNRVARELSSAEDAGPNILDEVTMFEQRCVEMIQERQEAIDVIHAHDWLTFPAAAAIARELRKPWIAHFHSSEVDRRGGGASAVISNIERGGTRQANHILVPSLALADVLKNCYGDIRDRIHVIPNCAEAEADPTKMQRRGDFGTRKILFAGRITSQKGPDYFIEAARLIYSRIPEARFIMRGTGDMVSEVRALIRRRFALDGFIAPAGYDDDGPAAAHVANVSRVRVNRRTGALAIVTASSSSEEDREMERRIARGGFKMAPYGSSENEFILTFDDGGREEMFLVRGNGGVLESGQSIVSLQGFVDWTERGSMFNGVSVLVVPSRAEPFGMVIVEAMQNGVPVVFSKDAGAAEIIKAGVRVEPSNVEEVADRVCEILNDEDRWHQIVEDQRKVMEDFIQTPYEDRVRSIWQAVAAS